MRIAVTGGNGLVGSSIKAIVHQYPEHEFVFLKRSDCELASRMAVMTFSSGGHNRFDCIIHLAALIGIPYSYEAPLSYVKTNIQGTVNVLESARKNEIPLIINTSTSETYGTAQYTPIDELHPMQGQSPYSASKISADKLSEAYYNSFETPVITVRPFNTYGPRQSSRAVIPTIISQLLTEKNLSLGDLSPVRDFTYVEDTVDGFINAAIYNKHIGEVINLGYGKAASIGEISRIIMEIMGINKEIISDHSRIRPKDSEVMNLISNNSKAKNLINWEPKIDLRKGLMKTIDFISNNLDFYKTNSYNI